MAVLMFEEAHAQWLEDHLRRRTGERRSRLERGHKHAEKAFLRELWWEIMGSFEDLHPEYEIIDWRGRPFYADFAWLPRFIKLIFEIKGFGPHVREMDRIRYCEELNRETYLQGMGYRVISIPYDDIEKRPDVVRALLRLILARYGGLPQDTMPLSLAEREIVLLACELARIVRPHDIETKLNVNHRTAVKHLQALCGKGWLRPIAGENGVRTMKYELVKTDLLGIV